MKRVPKKTVTKNAAPDPVIPSEVHNHVQSVAPSEILRKFSIWYLSIYQLGDSFQKLITTGYIQLLKCSVFCEKLSIGFAIMTRSNTYKYQVFIAKMEGRVSVSTPSPALYTMKKETKSNDSKRIQPHSRKW